MSREENCKVADKALNAADCHQKALVVLFLNLASDFIMFFHWVGPNCVVQKIMSRAKIYQKSKCCS